MDYNKLASFLTNKYVDKTSEILKVIINTHFTIDSISDDYKKIMLTDKLLNKKFVLNVYSDRILILPDNSINLYLHDDFGYLIEVSIDNDNLVLSNIFNLEVPIGIVSTRLNINLNTDYNVTKFRISLFSENSLDALSTNGSIESFINSFYQKRDSKFNDLYWDLDLLRKTLLIDALTSSDKNIFDSSYTNFGYLYQKLLDIIIIAMEKNDRS